MIKSMTGFGNAKAEQPFGSVTVEIKTVNSRYLDVQFRMPDELRLAEQPIRERIANSLTRGKIEVRASFARAVGEQQSRMPPELLQRVADQLEQARQTLPQTPSPSLTELLSWANAPQQTVEPEGWDDVARSLATGEIQGVAKDAPPTACDALQTPVTWPINFAILKERCPYGVAVTPAEVRAAQRFAFARLHLVLEPGGAAALAAALAGKVPLDGRTVIMLTGGNTDPASFAKVLGSND